MPIQNCNAEMTKTALVILRDQIVSTGIRAQLHLPIHDEIVSSCHKDDFDRWKTMQEGAMEYAAELYVGKGLLFTDSSEPLDKWTK